MSRLWHEQRPTPIRSLSLQAGPQTPVAGHPAPHRDDGHPGLRQLLLDNLPPNDIPRDYTHQGTMLKVVSVGAGTRGLQRLDRLRGALARWSQDYEYVLFDLAPLLMSADAEMLIEVLGQVFLVVPAESVTKGEIGRAKRLLQKLDPEAVGLFVNDVPLFRGSGYMEESIVETVTRGRFSHFMTASDLRLKWELLRTYWTLHRQDILRRPLAWLRPGSRLQETAHRSSAT